MREPELQQWKSQAAVDDLTEWCRRYVLPDVSEAVVGVVIHVNRETAYLFSAFVAGEPSSISDNVKIHVLEKAIEAVERGTPLPGVRPTPRQ